jgi:hypothetical protein
MMRPILRKMVPGSMLQSDPSKPYSGQAGHGTNKGAIKLDSISRGKDGDEASSTRELAFLDLERSSTNSNEYGQGIAGSYPDSHTFISGNGDAASTRRARAGSRGIHVKNEMTVSYAPA